MSALLRNAGTHHNYKKLAFLNTITYAVEKQGDNTLYSVYTFTGRVGDRYRGHPRTVVGNPGHISSLEYIHAYPHLES